MIRAFIIPVLLLCVSFVDLKAQVVYSVVKVDGPIFRKEGRAPLVQGEKVNADVELVFGAKTSKAVLISNKGERYILQQSDASANPASGEFITFLKDVLVPMKSMGALTTRGGEAEAVVDLKNYFGSGSYLIVGNEERVVIDKSMYPINENHYFHISYSCGGHKHNKHLQYDGEVLRLSRADIASDLKGSLEEGTCSKLKLYYHDKKRSDSRLITTFAPVFLDKSDFDGECMAVIKPLKEVFDSDAKIIQHVLNYLSDYYGKYDVDRIEVMVKELLARK